MTKNRGMKEVELEPFGMISDYVSFYFGYQSPMLLRIKTGYNNVAQRNQKDIIYLVSGYNLLKTNGLKFVFFDGHSLHHLSNIYNNDKGLENIDCVAVKTKQWSNESDPDLLRRKQAELLVHNEVPLSSVLGIGVYNETALQIVQNKLSKFNITLTGKIKKEWYY